VSHSKMAMQLLALLALLSGGVCLRSFSVLLLFLFVA
jgi:hypothetical protein